MMPHPSTNASTSNGGAPTMASAELLASFQPVGWYRYRCVHCHGAVNGYAKSLAAHLDMCNGNASAATEAGPAAGAAASTTSNQAQSTSSAAGAATAAATGMKRERAPEDITAGPFATGRVGSAVAGGGASTAAAAGDVDTRAAALSPFHSLATRGGGGSNGEDPRVTSPGAWNPKKRRLHEWRATQQAGTSTRRSSSRGATTRSGRTSAASQESEGQGSTGSASSSGVDVSSPRSAPVPRSARRVSALRTSAASPRPQSAAPSSNRSPGGTTQSAAVGRRRKANAQLSPLAARRATNQDILEYFKVNMKTDRAHCVFCNKEVALDSYSASRPRGGKAKRHLAACIRCPADLRAMLDEQAVREFHATQGRRRGAVWQRFTVVGYRRFRCHACAREIKGDAQCLKGTLLPQQ